MDDEDSFYDGTSRVRKFYQKKKEVISSQMKNQILYHRQRFERMFKKNCQKHICDLINDLNNSTNLKTLKFIVEDSSVQLSNDNIYDLLEELTFIQEPNEYDPVEFEARIAAISSVLEYIAFNIEMFHIGTGFYETISNQLEDCVSYYRNHSSTVSWATSLNHYIPKEETIRKYNLEFSLEYISSILKVLRTDGFQFRKVNLQVDHFLRVLVKSFRYFGVDGCIGKKIPSSFPRLEQSWDRLRNNCDFGNLAPSFFTDYYLLKKIKMIIQNWSCEGDKIMISKHGKWLLMEFIWMYADEIWLEERKYNRKNSSNDEIVAQNQLKDIMLLFGILDTIENYINESEHLSTLTLAYYFVKESLQKTRSTPIQIKSTVILLKLYFRYGHFSKIIDEDFENYFQDLSKENVEAATYFKPFLSAIKPRLYQEYMSNNIILFENFQGTILLPQMQNKRNMLSADKFDGLLNKNMIDVIADEITCSVALEPVDSLCILGCGHITSYETFLNISRMSRRNCPQCRLNIKDYECVLLPQHHIYSYFYPHFVTFGIVSTPSIFMVKTTGPHYFSTPLLSFDSITMSSQDCFDPYGIRSEDLPKPRHSSKIRWPPKVSKRLHPAYSETLKALKNKQYEEAVSWLTCLLKHYPNSYSMRCDRAFINSLLLRNHFLALEDLNIALDLKTKSSHALNLRGEIFRRIGYYDDALSDLNKALRLTPNNAISYRIRGALFYKMKRFNESLEDLNCSIKRLPNNGFCLGFLGATFVKLGFNHDALDNFNKALEINPEDVFILVKRAKLYHALYLDNSALIDINNALRINPCNHKALLVRSKICISLALGSNSEALPDINKSLEMKPNNVNALKLRASLYHEMNLNEEALDDLDKALNLKSNDISIFELRGEVYRSMCCFEKAIDDFNQMLKVDSRNIFALSYRGATKYDQELYEEALIDLNKALELRQENNSFILKIRAKIYIALERYHEALIDQNEILDNEPNNSDILLERREVYNKLGLCGKTHVNSAHRNRITLKPTYSC